MKLTLDDFQQIAKTAIENLDEEDPRVLSEWILRLGRATRNAAADYTSGLDQDEDEDHA